MGQNKIYTVLSAVDWFFNYLLGKENQNTRTVTGIGKSGNRLEARDPFLAFCL